MWRLLILICLSSGAAFSQPGRSQFADIDRYVSSVSSTSLDSLALLLTLPYSKEIEKARSIYSWIIRNVQYNTGRWRGRTFVAEPLDTAWLYRSGEEIAANRVLQRRFSVCEGYAKLFKVLCDRAGLQAVIITGYGRVNAGRPGLFKSNHCWNAVRIDSSWYLLDATWGSGYINFRDEFVQREDDRYFLADPLQFADDHHPEDLHWTLINNDHHFPFYTPAPFRYKAFDKYRLKLPAGERGIIRASVGDTMHMEIALPDNSNERVISTDPFFDTMLLVPSNSTVILYAEQKGKILRYTYVVDSAEVQWIILVHNKEFILRYRLRVFGKEKQPGN